MVFTQRNISCIVGILQREQENSVVYGSIDGGKTLSANEKFLELVKLLIIVIPVLFHLFDFKMAFSYICLSL